MSFVFIHTADWQIGKAFGAMPPDVAAVLAEARLGAIDRLTGLASEVGARHVLVAGDVFDADTLAPKTIRQALARIGRAGAITWHMLPGNHDAHRPGGLWEQLLADDPPPNLRAHLTAAPIEIERGVWLLPAPLTGRAAAVDPTTYFDAAATPAGALRIGLAHGSVRGFGSAGEAAINIAPTRAASARLDYLALGDWHGVKEIEPRTWYSGTPEPDRFAANAPGHALVVRVDAPGAPPRTVVRRVAQFAWLRREIALRGADDLTDLEAAITAAATRPSDVLVQLDLGGRVSAADRQAIGHRLRRIEASVRFLDADLAGLAVRAVGADLDILGAAGELRSVGERLAALATPAASDALTLLLDLTGEAGGASA